MTRGRDVSMSVFSTHFGLAVQNLSGTTAFIFHSAHYRCMYESKAIITHVVWNFTKPAFTMKGSPTFIYLIDSCEYAIVKEFGPYLSCYEIVQKYH